MPTPPPNDLRRWLPVVAAGGLLAVVVGVGVARGGGSAAPVPSVVDTSVSTALDPVPSVTAPAASTTVPVRKVALERTLGDGVTGDDVRMVQQRLADLGFDPGPVDGVYGLRTIQAVWAYEKLMLGTPRSTATGRVSPEMWDGLQDPIAVAPRRPSVAGATHVEIYLPEQVLAVFTDNQPVIVLHASSGELDANGEPAPYCDAATWDTDRYGNKLPEPVHGTACALAKTPGGVFTIHRMETGHHVSSLGGMDDPVYFNYGIAIHGAQNVPLEPASHGCVRINNHLSEYFQTLVSKGDKVLVWGEDGRQPEEYSERESLPSFDARTPDTTTTTSTISSTTPTTVPPVTTEPVDTTTTTTTTDGAEPPVSEPVTATTEAPDEPPTSEPAVTDPVNPDGGDP